MTTNDNITYNSNKYFYCYNPIKRDFICNMGQQYIDEGINSVTNKTYWKFKRSNKLDKILNNWRIFQQMRFETKQINNKQ